MHREEWDARAEAEKVIVAHSLLAQRDHGCRSLRDPCCAHDDVVAATENDDKEAAIRRGDGDMLRDVDRDHVELLVPVAARLLT